MKNKINIRNTCSFVLLPLMFTGMPSVAFADDEGSQIALEEIVVMARKREESLKNIPDSVVALGSDMIERANIVQVRDVTARIPNVSIEESLSPTSTFIGVRGVISTRNGEPAVAMVVDGVQITSASEISQAFHDVERIVVLKGPQGALYGRNAIGGAIIITSKAPTDELSGKVTVGMGTGDLAELDASLSGSINENLKFRIAGNFRDFSGTRVNEYLRELATGATTSAVLDLSDVKDAYTDFETNKDLRGRLIWTPSDKTTIDFRGSYSDLKAGAYGYRPSIRLETSNDYLDFPIINDVNSVAFRTIVNGAIKADHDFDSGITLTSITSYTKTEERYGVPYEGVGSNQMGDVDFVNRTYIDRAKVGLDPADVALLDGILQGVGSHNFYDIKSWSQEFRLISPSEDRFRWIVGVYGLLTDRNDTIRADITVPGSLPLEARLPNGLPGVTDFFVGGPGVSGLLFDTSNAQDNHAWALFANVDYDISDNLTLTVALRYDEDHREITRWDGPTVNTGGEGVGQTVFGIPECTVGVGGCVAAGFVEKAAFKALQPKASLAYQVTDDAMLYATYARGFRSGGFNASGALLAETYGKEVLDNFEIGQKSTWLEGRLQVNAAAFYENYKNAQVFEFDGAIFVQSLYNIPKSEIYGLEADFAFAATEQLTLSGGIGWLKSKIKEFDPVVSTAISDQLNARISNTVKVLPETAAAFAANFKGYKLPKFPHLSANFSVVHEMPVSFVEGATLITRLDYRVTGNRYWWIDNKDKQDFVHVLDGSIALEFDDNWEAVLWCKNCTNTDYDSAMEPQEMVLFGGPSKDVFYAARKRTVGLKVNYRF